MDLRQGFLPAHVALNTIDGGHQAALQSADNFRSGFSAITRKH